MGRNGHPSISASLFPVAQLHLLPQWAAIEADCTWEGLNFFLSHGSTRIGGQKFESFNRNALQNTSNQATAQTQHP